MDGVGIKYSQSSFLNICRICLFPGRVVEFRIGGIHMYRKLLCLSILLSTLLPASISGETGIPGWGEARWGMSHSAINKHFDLGPWEPGSTPTCKSKKKIRIWGQDFAIAFYFDERSPGGKLFKVVLAHFNPPGKDTAWLNAIKDMLVEKYGTPESFEVKGKMKITEWTKTDGRLKLTTVTGRTVMCAMEYMAVSMEGKKL